MKIVIYLFFLLLLNTKCFALSNYTSKSDTSKKPQLSEEQIIDNVIRNGTEEKKEDISYLSKITKYGFKELFKNYTYNPLIPYSQQVNPYAESYMQDYLQENTTYLLQLKKTGVPYFNLIDKILSQYGLPHELKYLAVIESNLKSTALSVAGARGPWQFMPYTAKDYGLAVNSMVDDRIDYAKSTNAAAKYLLNLYKDLKDWLLVIAAYNGGTGRVNTAIKKSGSKNFWKLQYYLPAESRNHVKKFIATHYIMESGKNETYYNNIISEDQRKADSVGISGKFNAAIIAKNVGISLPEFNNLNPSLELDLSKNDSSILRLPIDKMKLFRQYKLSILEQSVRALLFPPIHVQNKEGYKKRRARRKINY